jgi:hypothetical protein
MASTTPCLDHIQTANATYFQKCNTYNTVMDQMSIPILDQFCSNECNQLATNLIKAWGDEPCRGISVGGEFGDDSTVTLPLERNSTCLKNNSTYCVLEIIDTINSRSRFDKVGLTEPNIICTFCYMNWIKARVSPKPGVALNGIQYNPETFNKLCSSASALPVSLFVIALGFFL